MTRANFIFNSLYWIVFVFLIQLGCNCNNNRNRKSSDIPKGHNLPIDGIWKVEQPIGKPTTFKVEGGRIIFIDGQWGSFSEKDDVVCKDISYIGNNIYNMIAYRLNGSEVQGTILVQDDKLIFTYQDDSDPNKEVKSEVEYYLDSIFDVDAYEKTHKLDFIIENITYSDTITKADEQTQYVDKGARLTIERERTIRHVVQFEEMEKLSTSESVSMGVSGPIDIPLIKGYQIQLEKVVTRDVEKRMSRTFETTEIFRAKVELDGNTSSSWKIFWYDRVKKGLIKCRTKNGHSFTTLFSFPLSSEIRAISQ